MYVICSRYHRLSTFIPCLRISPEIVNHFHRLVMRCYFSFPRTSKWQAFFSLERRPSFMFMLSTMRCEAGHVLFCCFPRLHGDEIVSTARDRSFLLPVHIF
ncbi:hypothetical protein BDV18DRAFT_117153 [Aspergillus unguis]